MFVGQGHMSSGDWFYIEGDARRGPVSQAELAGLLQTKLPTDTLVWQEGLAEWSRADRIPEFLGQVPPPLPDTQAAQTTPPTSPSAVGPTALAKSVHSVDRNGPQTRPRPQARPSVAMRPHGWATNMKTLIALGAGLIVLAGGFYFREVKRRAVPPMQRLVAAAEAGDRDAQDSLGGAYERGRCVPQSYAQAAQWYLKAANQGSPSAQYKLGVLYADGKGVEQDETQAALWVRKAADQGEVGAWDRLGSMYLIGQGVPQDYVLAAVWYRKAAERDFASAQLSLAEMYRTGQGVVLSRSEAAYWYRRGEARKSATDRMTALLDEAFSKRGPRFGCQ